MMEPATGRLVSIPERSEPKLNNLALRQGRWVEAGRPDDVIVSENFAVAHGFSPGDYFFAIVNGRKRRLSIVGIGLSPEYIYAVGPGQLMPDDRTFGIIWMGRRALEAAFDLKGGFNEVSLSLQRDASAPEVIDRVDGLLDRYGGVGAYDRDDHVSHVFISNELTQLDFFGRILPPVFLGVAAFLLNIVMSRLIDTEREEIGLFKAFGYTNLEVGWHYLKLVIVLTTLGVLLGLGLGLWMGRGLAEIYVQFFRFPFLHYRVEPSIFAIATLISLAAAIAGTLQSVRRAVKLEPAVAMRPAPPAVYRKTLFKKLGFSHLLTEPTRMIWRHIERWPARAGLTSLGMSMSIAILVGCLFPLDAIEQVIEVFYFQAQRQDATISFVEPRNDFAKRVVLKLPGVLAAEEFRQVPVTLRSQHFTERVGITGINPDATVSRLLDSELRPIVPPPEGLVLSTYLSRVLNAGPGAVVRVETMSGKRPTVDMPVTAVVEEYIGLGAYMDLGALNRLMQEGNVVSGYNIMVDSARTSALYAALKETPVVGGITLKSTALRSFRDTIAETLAIALTFYIAFGGMIAFGVVYNSARISLSERSREFASLRVLGFTRSEVAFILLGELGFLTVLALPIGCLLGYIFAAGMAESFSSELFRIPLFIAPSTYAISMIVVIVAAVLSGIIVGRRINQLDMVAVLKTRD